MKDYAFQVNLAGVIELLSQHLYSGPQVYLRELLQNATDAVQARRLTEPALVGEISFEIVQDRAGGQPTLVVEDNGVGLTEQEVHTFLSTIGLSSKREELARQRGDFIGQFGIGLLSCFMVTDEIVMITRSANGNHPAVEWRGHGDGRYSLKVLTEARSRPGTTVYLRARADAGQYFKPPFVRKQLEHYGCFLPHRVEFVTEGTRTAINSEPAPWMRKGVSPVEWRATCLDYGKETFGTPFFDCFPLRVEACGIDGVGFVLPVSPSLATRRADRVYLKSMLLTDKADNLLPEWAFFVKCALNATSLNPNASREAFQEDEAFEKAREGLEQCLRNYLLSLAKHDQRKLQELVGLHFRAIKVLAADDDEFYRLFIDWLPFETSQGEQTIKALRADGGEIVYVSHIDMFRQMAQVAAAQSVCLVNAGYVCDVALLEKLPEAFPELTVRRLDPSDLLDSLQELSFEDQEGTAAALAQIERILARFQCRAALKRFRPADLPALYTIGEDAQFSRDVERSKQAASDMWAGMLDNMHGNKADARSQLCFNWDNPLVQKILRVRDGEVLRRTVELLYVQALLQGHYPLSPRERIVLSEGLTGLIDLAVQTRS